MSNCQNKKNKLQKFIKTIIENFFHETGPSAQGIIQPWLGPDFPDEEGVQDVGRKPTFMSVYPED
jgi:hypothetical protein